MTSDIDPDLNLDIPDKSCNYYDQDGFIEHFVMSTDIKLLHFNARSLRKNVSSIKQYINLLQKDFAVIGISETWLNDMHDPRIQIPNYVIEGTCRQDKRGGGVALFIQNDLVYKVRNDLAINNSDIESCFIELINTGKPNIIIGTVYKPPCVLTNNFTECLNTILSLTSSENKHCYIMGDYNINLLECDVDNSVQTFMNTILSQSFYPTIDKPTRITADTATLIDNILTNDLASLSSGVLMTDITDHLPVFLIVNSVKESHRTNKYSQKRNFNADNVENFIHDLNRSDWDSVTSINDIHRMFNAFTSHVQQLYNKHFPLKDVKCRYNKCKSPWLSEGIYNSIRRKNHLYRKFVRNPTANNKSVYTPYKNKLHSLIKFAKKTIPTHKI